MATITISRQLGSMGCEVARVCAQRLGYRMVWRELINQAASRACCPEVALATIDELGMLRLRPSAEAQLAYQRSIGGLMEELADEGSVVLVGRAGQIVLRGHPDTFHLRVIAPLAVRVDRIARRQEISKTAARAQARASDRARRNYLRRYYQANWDDPELYDLVLNTARLTPQMAADVIYQALKQGFPAQYSL